MSFLEVLQYTVIAIVGFFFGVVLLALFLGFMMALSDSCCGTNSLGRKNIQGTQYTAPTTVINVTSTQSHSSYQCDTRNSEDRDVEFRMCDRNYSYPMPAPEVRRNSPAMPSTPSEVSSENDHVLRNQVPEPQLPRNHVDVSSAVNMEDLPPSYDEAVGNA